MGKRQRNPEEGSPEVEDMNNVTTQDPPTKKPRKETNASAQRTLFVRSLPAIATSDALTSLFSESYPLKHATVVLDPETKQSKGYGFVTLADAEDAQRALDEFNGKAFMGRKMKIEIAQPRSREMSKGGGDAADGIVRRKSTISAEAAAIKKARLDQMAEDKKPPKLIIRNLPWSVNTPEKLADMFKGFGKVKFSVLPKNKDTQAGFGFITMRGKKNAEKALATVNGTLVDGRMVAVDWAVDKTVWETQNKSSKEDGSGDEDDGGVELAEKEKKPAKKAVQKKPAEEYEGEDDVANFFKNFGDQLESEDEDDEEPEQISDDDRDNSGSDTDVKTEDEVETWEDSAEDESEEEVIEDRRKKVLITDNSTTLFVRNLPFTTLDADLKEHFTQFGPVRYARVVMDRQTDRPKGTGFVCFYNIHDADSCFRNAPKQQVTGANSLPTKTTHSVLQNESADTSGLYTIDGRTLQVSKAVEKETAVKLTENGTTFRDERDKDKRKLYLLSEGTVASGTPLYAALAPSEIKMRQDSAMQRKKLIQNNPTLHLSLTRLSLRNLPKNMTSKDLKALAREAVVGFATDVKEGRRSQLSKEEEARGGDEMRDAEKQRKAKGKGIVRQAKIVFEGREGAKVAEESGAGKSRGYGFVEYSSHRWALMGLRWLNGHAVESKETGKKQRLIVEFAIENAQVVQRRKEKEEKARMRSKEIVELRAKGEAPEKEKKQLKKGEVMKKTRVGQKGKPGRPGFGKKGKEDDGTKGKSFEKVDVGAGKRKRDDDGSADGAKKKGKGEPVEKKFKPGFPPGEEGRLQRREQIIQKKRMMRRKRKGGA
ncbi:probable ribosomal processing [Rhynchosporium agropyri]|uniref:Probable ribosomal processing n=1 Tax=Rhynchosporium agropyri TaxID=914238 RepID=A0A1E1JYB0_9HELO|nr:probable ribosomal processing [Rhynchosporium agropyri]